MTLQDILILALLLYFAPTVVAFLRHRRNTMAIATLNLFLGWTLVGWVVSLVWAVSSEERGQVSPAAQTPSTRGMKKCPACAEFIKEEAKKCRYCGEVLEAARPLRSERLRLSDVELTGKSRF